MSLLRELKRRKVFRVAAAYAVVGWLLIQVATQVFPFFELPNWSVRLIVLTILAGFPIALVLAWAFDATAKGIERTDPPSWHSHGSAIAVGLIGVLIAALAGYTWWHWQSAPAVASSAGAMPSAAVAASVAADVPVKSIAVLPFVNMSSDKEQEYFSDGISEEEDWSYGIAYIYAYRGEADKAFEWLDKAVEYGDSALTSIVTDNLFDKIHADQRWLALLRKIGRAPEQQAKIEFKVTLPQAEGGTASGGANH